MADKVITDYTLQISAEFADGDTRMISVDSPSNAESLGAAVYNLQTFLQNNSVIIGDKAGATFTRFGYANKVTKVSSVLDLGLE